MELQYLFIIVYVIIVTVFLLMPKKRLDNVIKRDMDKDFNPQGKGKLYTALGYYKIVIFGGAITAALITVLIKIVFY